MTTIEMLGSLLASTVAFGPGAVVAIKLPRASTRWSLAVAFALTIPVIGAVLALVVVRTRGTNQFEKDLEPEPSAPIRVTPEDIARMGGQPPLLDRLMSADPTFRLSALESIMRRPDREAIELLRWTISHGESESVLDAALTLEELELKWRSDLDEANETLSRMPCYEAAVVVADVATQGIADGIVDAAIVDDLASEARACYEKAAILEPSRSDEVELRQARLELVAGEPIIALSIVDALRHKRRKLTAELSGLRDRARFALRRRPSREISLTVFAEDVAS